MAARNVLVDHNKLCKVADFGLSRSVRDTAGEMYEQRVKVIAFNKLSKYFCLPSHLFVCELLLD